MFSLDMTVQIRPSQAGYIALIIGAIVSQKQYGILEDLVFPISDAEIVI